MQVNVERRNDGSTVVRSTEPLAPYARTLNDCLLQWANAVPDRTFVAIRGADGNWLRVSYAQMLVRVKAVGQSLLALGATRERLQLLTVEYQLQQGTCRQKFLEPLFQRPLIYWRRPEVGVDGA